MKCLVNTKYLYTALNRVIEMGLTHVEPGDREVIKFTSIARPSDASYSVHHLEPFNRKIMIDPITVYKSILVLKTIPEQPCVLEIDENGISISQVGFYFENREYTPF